MILITVWSSWIFFQVKRPLLLVGEPGTSKTAIIEDFVRQLDPETYVGIHTYGRLKNIYTR
jgi:MoxR-like ATPase